MAFSLPLSLSRGFQEIAIRAVFSFSSATDQGAERALSGAKGATIGSARGPWPKRHGGQGQAAQATKAHCNNQARMHDGEQF
ncbi:hypothetical protein OOU_Y34scaffold00087g61 [Pyricularia oryzae Y34]|uniref:Uncharacterized protein n=2 Tax=Pyricularia oryzae TaxID=318829 RepID=A0AA97PRQ9_PYRO3|nr:hypothetical protein OOU_Y34scaffold00087g61 [Pyricularia oryzae Y34]